MPDQASKALGSRGRVEVRGTINGYYFRSSAFPDGKGSHAILVTQATLEAARAASGMPAVIEIEVDAGVVAFKVPADLQDALGESGGALVRFEKLSPQARTEWIGWVARAKTDGTRQQRIQETVRRLENGQRRPSE